MVHCECSNSGEDCCSLIRWSSDVPEGDEPTNDLRCQGIALAEDWISWRRLLYVGLLLAENLPESELRANSARMSESV